MSITRTSISYSLVFQVEYKKEYNQLQIHSSISEQFIEPK